MSRLFPYPILTLALLIMWLLLQQSVGLGHVIFGGVIAILASLAMAQLQPPKARLRNPHKLVWLFVLVTLDILRSNLAVIWIVVTGAHKKDSDDFVEMPLELTDRYGLALLACIITAAPGSAWLEYDPVRKTVLIHVLDLIDREEWVATIKHRYESRLLEIFQ